MCFCDILSFATDNMNSNINEILQNCVFLDKMPFRSICQISDIKISPLILKVNGYTVRKHIIFIS